MTFVERIIEEAKSSLAHNIHGVPSEKLAMAVANLEGRRLAVAEIAATLRAAAGDLDRCLTHAKPRIVGHGMNDLPYSQLTTQSVFTKYADSVDEVLNESLAFAKAKLEAQQARTAQALELLDQAA